MEICKETGNVPENYRLRVHSTDLGPGLKLVTLWGRWGRRAGEWLLSNQQHSFLTCQPFGECIQCALFRTIPLCGVVLCCCGTEAIKVTWCFLFCMSAVTEKEASSAIIIFNFNCCFSYKCLKHSPTIVLSSWQIQPELLKLGMIFYSSGFRLKNISLKRNKTKAGNQLLNAPSRS